MKYAFPDHTTKSNRRIFDITINRINILNNNNNNNNKNNNTCSSSNINSLLKYALELMTFLLYSLSYFTSRTELISRTNNKYFKTSLSTNAKL